MAEYRKWRDTNRVSLKDVVPLRTPYNLMIEISSICNAKCIYCAHSTNHCQYVGNMSDELVDRIIDNINEFPDRLKKIDAFGFGEPLCNSNFVEIISKLKKKSNVEKIDFTTNGILMTPNMVDQILKADAIDTIRISLQGLNAEMYKMICGVDIDFEDFVKNLKYLYEQRGNVKIRMKIADIAIKNIADGEKKYREIFEPIADSIFIEHIIPMFAGVDYDKIDKDINRMAINGRENIKQTNINKICNRPFYRMAIRANGDITASCCDSTRDITYGNINKERLVDIWNGNVRNEFLKLQLEGRRFEHPYCQKCMVPNDITAEEDILDPFADEVLKRFQNVIDKK